MNSRRIVGLTLLTGCVGTLLFLALQQGLQPVEARQHLDNLLGQASPESPEIAPALPVVPVIPDPLKFPDLENTFFGIPLPTTDIMVEETSAAYVLRVPLASAEDSAQVKVEVTPHRIEVSGQTGSKSEGQTVSSSFMQTFSTNQEVLPDQVHRRTEQNGDQTELVVTIPKKAGGDPKTILDGGDFEEVSPNPSSPEETPSPLLAPPPMNNENPLDNFGNRMI